MMIYREMVEISNKRNEDQAANQDAAFFFESKLIYRTTGEIYIFSIGSLSKMP
jgi:hypothetical protein